MIKLKEIVSAFSMEDQQRFIHYLEKKNKRNDTKNIILFKHLLKNDLNSKDICFKLYGNKNKDAYHALRKRLYQSVIDFTANSSLQEENSIDMQIIKYILAARNFMYNKHYQIAYKTLDKAEGIALEHHLFPLLNEIYHTKIQYAYSNPLLNIDLLITQFKTNKKNLHLEDQLNIVYAKMRQTLNNITFKGETIDFQTILNNTLTEYKVGLTESMSFKSLYQLITIINISAFVTNDYLKTEPFLISTYKTILTHKSKEKQPYYHIQILFVIANTLFRNKKFEASMQYLKIMLEHMHMQQKKHFNTFKLKHTLLLSLNLNYTRKQEEAIKLFEPLITLKHPDLESLLDIHLSLVMFYFQKNDYKKANTLLSKFYHTDNWYLEKAGKEWVIKKNLIEILLFIELGYVDLVESRLLSFKRHYYDYLKSIHQERVITYLVFVERYYKNPETVTSSKFKNAVETSFNWVEKEREDIFVMSFYAWLKAKMNQQDLYSATLCLIEDAKNN